MDNIKVIFLAPLPPPMGGIATWAERILKAEWPDNYNVSIVDEKMIGRNSHSNNVLKKKISVELKRCIRIWKDLRNELNTNEQPVVMHICSAATTTGMIRDLVSIMIGHRYGAKTIMHYRCTVPYLMSDWVRRNTLKFVSNITDCVFVLNDKSKEYLQKVIKKPVILIPNFIDQKNDCEKRNISEVKKVLYTGGVTADKGCDTIIEVAKAFPDIEFRLVGPVRDDIQKMEITKNVVLTGNKKYHDVLNELKEADLFLFLSHMESEGFSNSLLEAMAMGLPCIVSDWAANADMVDNQSGGYVCRIDNSNDVIEAIRQIMKNDVNRMGEYNYDKVSKLYTEEVILKKYMDEYERLI